MHNIILSEEILCVQIRVDAEAHRTRLLHVDRLGGFRGPIRFLFSPDKRLVDSPYRGAERHHFRHILLHDDHLRQRSHSTWHAGYNPGVRRCDL